MLITADYQQEMRKLHVENPVFGIASTYRARDIRWLMEELGFRTVLDYGSGKGRLGKALKAWDYEIQVVNYDPGLPEFAVDPHPEDFVACVDVLEHIEPDCLDDVLAHLKSKIRKVGYLTIAHYPAGKFLSDGRNAHLIVQEPEWWRQKLAKAGFKFHPLTRWEHPTSIVRVVTEQPPAAPR